MMETKNPDDYPLYRFKPNVFIMIGSKDMTNADGTYALVELDLVESTAKLEEIHAGIEITLRLPTFKETMVRINE